MNITSLFPKRSKARAEQSRPSLPAKDAAAPNRQTPAAAPRPLTRTQPSPNPNFGGLLQGLDENFAPKAEPVASPWLRKGAMGEDVRRLQRLLRSQGAGQIAVDGILGPQTQAAVKRLQAERGLPVDGIVGPKTWEALQREAPAPRATPVKEARPPRAIPVLEGRAPRAIPVKENLAQSFPQGGGLSHPSKKASPAERATYYKNLLGQHGVKVRPGQVHVLGLRGLAPDGARTSSTDGNRLRATNKEGTAYNDSFVVLSPNRQGSHDAHLLRGASYPGQSSSLKSPDVNRDGVGDVGMLRPGTYLARSNGEFYGASSYRLRRTDGSTRLPGWRDTNQNGDYSDQERGRSQSRGNTVSGILFHQGDPTAPNSIGCQTLSPKDFQAFVKAVGGPKGSFTYTLLDAGR